MPQYSREKKVILITGCSSGFGLLTAARLSTSGHHVFATMRNLENRSDLFEAVKRRGGQVNFLPLDVTNHASIKAVVSHIGSQFGNIDVLINNAGFGIGGFFEDLTEIDIHQIMDVNFFGVQNVIRQVIPFMRPKRRGRIINISSVAGFSSSPCFGAYNASKWALEGFSESLRHELKLFGIDVLLVEPGTYRTKIFYENAHYAKNFSNPNSPYFLISSFLEKKVRQYVDNSPKDPEDVARLVEKLIYALSPPFRNHPDWESRILSIFKRFMPFRIYESIMQKALFSDLKLP